MPTNIKWFNFDKNCFSIAYKRFGLGKFSLNLTALSSHNNRLSSLDVSNNSELGKLHCDNNQLTQLDISKNKKLEYFYCAGNPGSNGTFVVSAWFDNNSIPTGPTPNGLNEYYFITDSWDYNGTTVTIDYQNVTE